MLPVLTATALLLPQDPPQVKHLWRPAIEAGATGTAVTPAGDWDGDGVGDYAVGRPDWGAGVSFFEEAGAVTLVSGVNGSQIFTITNPSLTPPDFQRLGESLAGPFDSDGDGLPEIAVGAPGAEQVIVFESTGTLVPDANVLTTIPSVDSQGVDEQGFGSVVVNLGDLDGDGRNELAVGAPWTDVDQSILVTFNNAGAVRVFDGDGFVQRRNYTFGGAGSLLGSAITSVSDLDGDGLRDIAIGAPGFGTGEVHLVDYGNPGFFTTPVLSTIAGTHANERFGSSLADLGNFDLFTDASELLIGAPGFSTPALPAPISRGRVEVRSLENNALRWERQGLEGGSLGSSVAAVDLNGNGLRSAVVVEDSEAVDTPNFVLALEPQGGGLETAFPIPTADAASALANAGDLDGDGGDELLVGLPSLEFDLGGVLAQGLNLNPGPGSGSGGVFTVDDDGPADFDSLQVAGMVVGGGATLLVQPGVYDSLTLTKPMRVLRQGSPTDVIEMDSLIAVGVPRFYLEGFALEQLVVRNVPGRATLSNLRVFGETTAFDAAGDLVVNGATFLPVNPEGFELPGRDAVIVEGESSVQFESCVLFGADGPPITADGGTALVVREGSRVWFVRSSARGGDGSAGEPEFALPGGSGGDGIRVEDASAIDLRGFEPNGSSGGSAGPFGKGLTAGVALRTLDEASAVVSSALPELTSAGNGFKTAEGTPPWLNYEARADIGGTLTLEAYGESGAPLVLLLGLAPAKLANPQLFGIDQLVDLNQLLSTDVVLTPDPQSPAIFGYPVPLVPSLVGLELHLQGVTLDAPEGFAFEGTNGGAIAIGQ